MSREKIQPVQKIRHGAISGSIWRQESEKGILFNVTFQRTYRDNGEWKYTTSFGRRDLLVLALIASRSFEWIAMQLQKERKQPVDSARPVDDVPF
jgi:hypothetical protein